jgi:hypothetical protein
MRSFSLLRETWTETKRWYVPTMSTLLIPVEIAIVNDAYNNVLQAKTDSATSALVFAYLGGTFTDVLINERTEEGWFDNPPTRFPLRQILVVFLTGVLLSIALGLPLGYTVVMWFLKQPLVNPLLIFWTFVSLILFKALYPAIYLSGLWVMLTKFPGQRERCRRFALPARNIIMTPLSMIWNFVAIAPFLAP